MTAIEELPPSAKAFVDSQLGGRSTPAAPAAPPSGAVNLE